MPKDVLDKLFSAKGVSRISPGSRAKTAALAKLVDQPLPDSLLQLWNQADGLALESLDAHVLGPTEITRLIKKHPWHGLSRKFGFVPILDDHESNALAIALAKPLTGRIVYVLHDDSPRLLYGSFDSLLRHFLKMLREADEDSFLPSLLRDSDGDYADDSPRSREDISAAKILLRKKNDNNEWNYAIQLLGSSAIDELARLLETDHFVRRDVVARMKKMKSPAIKKLLANDRRAFNSFAAKVTRAARASGFKVAGRSGDCLGVNGHWMNLDAFFYRRNIPSAIPRIMDWFRDLIAKRNPRDRPGHFMTD